MARFLPSDSFLGEGLYYEHVITTHGFDRAYSIQYHLRPPTRITQVEHVGNMKIEKADDEMAVMFDTNRKLHLTRQALDVEDRNYPMSWLAANAGDAEPMIGPR